MRHAISILLVTVSVGCGRSRTPVVSVPTATVPTATVPTATVPTATVPTATVPIAAVPAASVPTAPPAPACAHVNLSYDRRALPTSATPEAFDLWVRGNADEVRRSAPAGTRELRMFLHPGVGSVEAVFDGDTQQDVLRRCQQTVDKYLPTAPQLPLIGFGSATHVTSPCRACD